MVKFKKKSDDKEVLLFLYNLVSHYVSDVLVFDTGYFDKVEMCDKAHDLLERITGFLYPSKSTRSQFKASSK